MSLSVVEWRKRLQNPHLGRFYSDWTEYLQRIFSIYITLVVGRTPLRANHVTMINGVLLVPIGYLLAEHHSAALFSATFLVFVHMTLDCVDGELARLKGDGSLTGLFLDRLNTTLIYPLCFVCLAVGLWRKEARDLPLFLGFAAAVSNLLLRSTYGNIISCVIDGLTSRKAKGDMARARSAAYSTGQSGKEGVGGDIRRQIRGNSVILSVMLDAADVILTRSMGLVLLMLAAATGVWLDIHWPTGFGPLSVAEVVLAGYSLLALAATMQLAIKAVKTQYPERIMESLVDS